jgi:hypothetical protein
MEFCPSIFRVPLATTDGKKSFIKKLALEMDCNPKLMLRVTLRRPRPDRVVALLRYMLLRDEG